MTFSYSPSPGIVTASMTETKFYMGVDLGQQQDPSAIAVLRRVRELVRQGDGPWREAKPTVLQLGFLERIPLGTPYPGIVTYIAGLLQRPVWAGNIQLAIDQTGVGRPVADIFRSRGLSFTGVNITSGLDARLDGNEAFVPKTTLVSLVQALIHEERLHLHSELGAAPDLRHELESFQVRYTDGGRMTFGASGNNHDDMVLALAIAAWRSTMKEPIRTHWARSNHMER
jgi:hypothetical protein